MATLPTSLEVIVTDRQTEGKTLIGALTNALPQKVKALMSDITLLNNAIFRVSHPGLTENSAK